MIWGPPSTPWRCLRLFFESSPWPPTGSSGCILRHRWPIRWTTDRLLSWVDLSTIQRPTLAGGMVGTIEILWESFRNGGRHSATIFLPLCRHFGFQSTPFCWRASGAKRYGRPPVSPEAHSPATGRALSSVDSQRIACSRSPHSDLRRSGSCSDPLRMRSAGPFHAVALAHFRQHWSATWRRWVGPSRRGDPVHSLSELAGADAILLDLTPRQIIRVAGSALPERMRRALAEYRYGPGVFKMDWALSAPIPWRDPQCLTAATVHVGGTLDELVMSEAAPWQGRPADRPFVLLVQPSLFDSSRAPVGRHTVWAYCHVPNGADDDMTSRIEAQIERFAPGFRDVVLARSVMPPSRLEAYDGNLVGGDLGGGANVLRQIIFRPVLQRVPYSLGIPGVFICSSSTPPGGGVHGMCGYHAATAVLAVGSRASHDGSPE